MRDLISRPDAVRVLTKMMKDCFPESEEELDAVVTTIYEMPFAEPERKKGKWIPVDSETVNGRCSVCGYESRLYENDVYGENYCPNCGSEITRGE